MTTKSSSVIVKTQEELDAALLAKTPVVYIESPAGVWLYVGQDGIPTESSRVVARESSSVVAWESSSVEAWESSSVEAWGSSRVEARESSRVVARESSRVVARESSSVVARESSSVEAWGSSRVEARESSRVEARESSRVVARESSRVVARESSRVEARESSSVEAWGSSRVEARESSSVEAWGSSSVVARESSSVEAWGSSSVEAGKYVAIHLHSAKAKINGGVLIDLTKIDLTNSNEWLEYHGVEIDVDGNALLYKAVNDEFQTDRGPEWTYAPGNTVVAKDFRSTQQCGQGLHLGITPRHSRNFYSDATRFVAVKVKVEGLVPLDDKCKVRSCEVLHEVDINGDKLVTA